jgi:hypothetical protein
MPAQRPAPLHDVAIVGAGIAGVVHLAYARRAGLDAVVLEAQDGPGGLWRRLPAWQDLQIAPADWALGDVGLDAPFQPQVLANVQGWIDRFGLADGIRHASPVLRARHDGSHWQLATAQGPVRARHLVAASGAHNRPLVPAVARHRPQVAERHASALHDTADLAGRRVLVVGGGASAYDLLEQALTCGASHVAWAHRGLKWFLPTGKPKAVAGSVRPYARLQLQGLTHARQSAAIGADMAARYARFGLDAIRPARPWDVRHDQLIPGRPGMLAQFGRIERHAATVAAIDGATVQLSDGTRLQPELLLWGTGYATELGWLDVPALAAVRDVDALAARCGCIVRSLDAPDLWLPGVGLDGIGAAPWAYALLARSTMAHIAGRAALDLAPVGHKVNHMDIAFHLAPRDRASYPDGWREQLAALVRDTPDDRPYPLPA